MSRATRPETSDPVHSVVSPEGYPIIGKRLLAPDTWDFSVLAPMVAHGRRPGQFLMVQPFEKCERIPLTLIGGDAERGTIRFVIMEAGATTKAMGKLNVGDRLFAVAGPMGQPTKLAESGAVLLMAGGFGSAAILPTAEELHTASRRVITILGGRSAERVLLADELRAVSAEIIITTDDGSLGRKGIVTDALSEILGREAIAQVIAVGPLPMMRAVSEMTRPMAIPTVVSLNALMVDGTGMCGGCRVSVGGEIKFACFHGPDFDGHKVDFEMLQRRKNWYKDQERVANADHICSIGLKTKEAPELAIPETEATADFDWKTADLTSLKANQRMKLPRQEMACQNPLERVKNFREVSLGLSHYQARIEAARCIQCKEPDCVHGCPVNIAIPAFIREIAAGNPLNANRIIKRDNPLGAVCGRVCPQEKQCEARCVLGVKAQPVSIGRLERYASDMALGVEIPATAAATGKRVAVVGAGPAGLTAAGDLARLGHDVVVYDALTRAGGVLRYGIPEFRLPNSIVDAEVQTLKAMGVKFIMNALIGRSLTLSELRRDFDSVFISTGAGLPKLLGAPGEDLKGVYAANEFLTRVNLMRADMFPETGTPVTVGKHVIVVGCGNTAMDAARCSLRLGANATVAYRRSVAESTARQEELEHAREEGVVFKWLTTPIALRGDENGWVKTAECAVMELTDPDQDGRRGVKDTDGRVILPCDTLIVALGCAVNPLLSQQESTLKTQRGGVLVVDETTGETSLPGVFAAGDVITGGATVILAMGQARRAARAMHRYMCNSASASKLQNATLI
ncbi:MAG: NADPH-dependent glutamate synthase [Holophagales bacterium]|nr:NADPH-dependent glutamate synthase [Holophagales bacterium]